MVILNFPNRLFDLAYDTKLH
ncbi:hypothetical protein MTBLM1_80110 [Rhodospirillaceae bacterium LM-1]|nr:hypothetical protein MTBLM1_80110 [Rhodospirillaceae bacterium LM-1]